TADVLFGFAPLTVQLSSAGSADPDGDVLSLEWDLDGDGSVDSTDPTASITFLAPAPDLPFEFGDSVEFEVVITDDTPVDCARLSVEHFLVHDQHGHS